MTSLQRRPLLVVLSLAVVALAFAWSPTTARADSVSWTRTYYGPDNILSGEDYLDVAARFNKIDFFDASSGWAVGTWTDSPTQYSTTKTGLLAFSSNAGSTWTTSTAPAGSGTEIHAVVMITASKAFAVTSAGKVLRWSGPGSPWEALTVSDWPETGYRALRGIAFTDATHGWAVGDLGGVAKTVDGGATWTTVQKPASGGAYLRAITAVSSTKCIAVGDGGAIRAITASGVTAVSSGTTKALRGVAFADATHGWAVGDDATMKRTTDGGVTWTSQTVQYLPNASISATRILAIAFADALNGMAVGTYQQVWRTSDGGATWTRAQIPLDTGGAELRGISFADGSAVPVVVGSSYDGQITHETDKARAFRGSWVGSVPPPPAAPGSVTLADAGAPGPRIAVTWADSSTSEDGYTVERAQDSAAGPWTQVYSSAPNSTSWTDSDVDWASTWFYRVRSVRGAEVSAWTTSSGYRLDVLPPVTGADVPLVNRGAAHLVLNPSDGGSGVASTEWALDGTPGTGTVIDTSEIGEHTLRFRSLDVAGNVEDWHEVVFYVTEESVSDVTAPVTTRRGPAWTYYVAPATVSLDATDGAGVGILRTFCTVNGGSPIATSTLTFASTGTYVIEYWSADLAGNKESTRSITITVLTRPYKYYPSKPVVPSTVRKSTSFKTYGYVNYHKPRTYPVTILFYRYRSGKYVYYKSIGGKSSTIAVSGTDFSQYTRTTSVPYTGKWRVRVKHVVSGRSYYSSYSYFTVN